MAASDASRRRAHCACKLQDKERKRAQRAALECGRLRSDGLATLELVEPLDALRSTDFSYDGCTGDDPSAPGEATVPFAVPAAALATMPQVHSCASTGG